jgi:formylmethanofuran dehydrogenase subunit B
MSKARPTLKPSDSESYLVCTGCGCLCDDIIKPKVNPSAFALETAHDSNLCSLGGDWFRSFDWLKGLSPSSKTLVFGQEASLDIGIIEAQRLIAQSKSPLICSLEGLGMAAQSAAWRLADRIRATIDVSLNRSGRGGVNALQRVGRVTATMGEVAQRSDLVLLWFVDPQVTQPRLWERAIRPKHDPHRVVVVVDEYETLSARQATQFICLDRSKATRALSVLRALLTGSQLHQTAVTEQTGFEASSWGSLLDQLLNSNYGAWLSRAGADSEFDAESESLGKLIRLLNDSTRFVNLSLRHDYNALGAENVLAWSSGFTSSVNLNRSFPRSCFTEYSAESLLIDRGCDLILLTSMVGLEDAWQKLAPAAQSHFEQTPKIILNELGAHPTAKRFQAHVEFSVARPGYNGAGDFCRQDDVLIPLSQIANDDGLISAAEVLDRLSAI